MDTSIKERQIAKLCRDGLLKENQNQVIQVSCQTGRDIRQLRGNAIVIYFYDDSLSNILDQKQEFVAEYYDELKELLIYKADHGEIYSDILITLYPDGSYQFKYWFDEERFYKEEFKMAALLSQRFPHIVADDLLDYQLPEINFKKKYAKIIMTLEIRAGEPAVDLHYKNGRNQVKPVFDFINNTSQSYQDSVENVLTVLKEGILEQYNVTHGIMKEFWEPWNKIIIEVPPSGILNELEDIHYYLDDKPLDKKYFTRGYFDMEKWEYVKYR